MNDCTMEAGRHMYNSSMTSRMRGLGLAMTTAQEYAILDRLCHRRHLHCRHRHRHSHHRHRPEAGRGRYTAFSPGLSLSLGGTLPAEPVSENRREQRTTRKRFDCRDSRGMADEGIVVNWHAVRCTDWLISLCRCVLPRHGIEPQE